jgi:hypothetical protein
MEIPKSYITMLALSLKLSAGLMGGSPLAEHGWLSEHLVNILNVRRSILEIINPFAHGNPRLSVS